MSMSRFSRSVVVVAAAIMVTALAGCTAATHPSAAPAAATTPVASSHPAAPKATPTPPPRPVSQTSPACTGTPAGTKHIYVSISQQHLWACAGTVLFTNAPVTTGASALTNVHDATPLGTTAITSKSRNVNLIGSDVNGAWNDHVDYWMPFNGGDGFHNAPWQKFPLGSPLYTTQGSHGCVHLPLPVLAALYNWAPIGTPVTVRT